MPHFTLQISPGGPILNAVISVSEARATALVGAGQEVPQAIPIRALVDTGATCTCIEPSILEALQLTPIGQVPTFTPSTGSTPQPSDQFDVGLFIPGIAGAVAFTRLTLLVIAAKPDSLHPQGFQGLIGRDVLERCLLGYNGTMGLFTLAY